MYDIAIIGGGPAGAMLARLVGKKFKVILLDKRCLDNECNNNINKCCGGLLAPDAQNIIARLGLGIPKEILVDPQLFAVRTIDIKNNLEGFYQRFYFNMDRDKFDKWLVSLIPDEVDKRFGSTFKNFQEIDEGYRINYIRKGNPEDVKARTIIGADGAFSKVRRIAFSKEPFPKTYISIQEWFKRTEYMPYFTAVFDEEISDFYSWIIPKGDNVLLGSALKPGSQAKEKFLLLKKKLVGMGFSLENSIKTEGAYIYRPTSTRQICFGKDNIALIGEAAGAISPSSAEGFSYAFKSALYLAESLEEGLEGFTNRYKHKSRELKRNVFFKNLKSPAMYNPGLRKIAIKSGLQRMNPSKCNKI